MNPNQPNSNQTSHRSPASNLDLSVVIIALNEERSLNSCLNSIPKGAEIVLIDSGSNDRTVAIAEKFGAKVVTRSFDNYAAQKNAGIEAASRNWILSIDADEVISDSLASAIIERVAEGSLSADAFRVRRQLVFMGRKMRHGKTIDCPIRLFRKGRAEFVGPIHEVLQCDDPGMIEDGVVWHYSYDDLCDYFDKFNNYTSKIARNHHNSGKRAPNIFQLALRPWFEFFWRYVIKLGFLDGYAGYCYAYLSSVYMYVKYEKLRELGSK